MGSPAAVSGWGRPIPRRANACTYRLEIPEERTVHNIERYGNTTGATIPIGLSESWRDGKIGPGTRVLMAAFGAGYTWAGAVAKF